MGEACQHGIEVIDRERDVPVAVAEVIGADTEVVDQLEAWPDAVAGLTRQTGIAAGQSCAWVATVSATEVRSDGKAGQGPSSILGT